MDLPGRKKTAIWYNDKGHRIQVLPVRHSLYRRSVHFTVPRQLLKEIPLCIFLLSLFFSVHGDWHSLRNREAGRDDLEESPYK